jgi:drug/metabolite transporter (DMT)-like permease
MTSDESDAITSYNLDDEPDEDLPLRRYWWSLHRPETYAITALAIGFASLFTLGPATDLIQSILYALAAHDEKTNLLTVAGIRLGMALLGILAAAMSIRDEDENSTWSPPVARAALLLAVLAAVFSAAAMIVTAATSATPNDFGG